MSKRFDLILFDLGGVLIELTGMPRFREWNRHSLSEAEIWQKWLTSTAVVDYESGRIASEEFAARIIREFDLTVEPGQFMQEFNQWPSRPYDGVQQLLGQLKPHYKLACLSNTSPSHYARIAVEMDLVDYFDYQFLSFQLGLVKPSSAIYQAVLDQTAIPSERILFLDDNQINIDGAVACGITAVLVKGFENTKETLRTYKIF